MHMIIQLWREKVRPNRNCSLWRPKTRHPLQDQTAMVKFCLSTPILLGLVFAFQLDNCLVYADYIGVSTVIGIAKYSN